MCENACESVRIFIWNFRYCSVLEKYNEVDMDSDLVACKEFWVMDIGLKIKYSGGSFIDLNKFREFVKQEVIIIQQNQIVRDRELCGLD